MRREFMYEVRTTEAVHGLVVAGLGISIIGPIFPLDSTHPSIVVRPFRPRIEIDLALLYPADKPLSRIAERFIEIVEEYASGRSGPRKKAKRRL